MVDYRRELCSIIVAAVETSLGDGYHPTAAGLAKGASQEAARRLGMTPNRLRHYLRVGATQYKLAPREVPSQSPRTVQTPNSLLKKISDLESERDALKSRVGSLDDIKQHVFGLESDPRRLIEFSSEANGALPCLFTSDFQAGEIINSSQMRGVNAYDLGIFRARYDDLIAQACSLTELRGYTGPFLYLRGGDSISGRLHVDTQLSGEAPTPVQVLAVIEAEVSGIASLVERYGQVTVVSVPGNHDRVLAKPVSKDYTLNSFELIIQWALRARFESDDRVRFVSHDSGDVLFSHGRINYLLTHGDRIGTRGGQGFIGAAAPIIRGAKKVRDQYLGEGVRVDVVCMGHHHSPLYEEGVVCNGSLAGFSQYARDLRFRPTPPAQTMLFLDPDYGVSGFKLLYVGERSPKGHESAPVII